MKHRKQKKYEHVIIKLQRPILGADTMLAYDKEQKIMGQIPISNEVKALFGDRLKIYCRCRYRNSDGMLFIDEEVDDNF